jgi:hypothetical protein
MPILETGNMVTFRPQKVWQEDVAMGRPRKPVGPPTHCAICGKPIETRTYYRKDGSVHSYSTPTKYCSLVCTGKAASEMNRGGGRGWYIDKHGYRINNPTRDDRGKQGYAQPEHRAAMEAHIGRALKPHETVHHIDGNRQNNAIENLELWSNRHGKGQRVVDKIDFCIDFLREYGYQVIAPEKKGRGK